VKGLFIVELDLPNVIGKKSSILINESMMKKHVNKGIILYLPVWEMVIYN